MYALFFYSRTASQAYSMNLINLPGPSNAKEKTVQIDTDLWQIDEAERNTTRTSYRFLYRYENKDGTRLSRLKFVSPVLFASKNPTLKLNLPVAQSQV